MQKIIKFNSWYFDICNLICLKNLPILKAVGNFFQYNRGTLLAVATHHFNNWIFQSYNKKTYLYKPSLSWKVNLLNGAFLIHWMDLSPFKHTPYRLILCTLPGPLLFRAHSLFIGLRNSVPYIMYMYMYIPLWSQWLES